MNELNIDYFINKYVNIVSEFYPGLANDLNIKVEHLGFYNNESNASFINNLLQLKIEVSEEIDNDFKNLKLKQLLKNIDMRIFEIEHLQEHKYSCMFYVEKIFLTLEETFEFDDIDTNSMLKNRLNHLNDSLKSAMDNLITDEIGQVDFLISLNRCRDIWNNILKLGKKLVSDDHNKAVEFFLCWLEKKYKTSKKKFKRLNKDLLTDYLNIFTGIDINIDSIYESGNVLLLEFEDYDNNEDKRAFTEEEVMKELKYLYSKLSNSFKIDEGVISDINIQTVCGENSNYFSNVRYAAYKSGNTIVSKQPTFIYNLDYMNCKEKMLLKLIHEVYPGHHYLRSLLREKMDFTIYDEMFFEEGWAKYCEYECSRLLKDEKLFKIMKSEFRHMILVGNVILMVHYYNYSDEDILRYLTSENNVDSKIAKNMLITSYLNPLGKIKYYIGFLLIKSIFDKYEHVDYQELLLNSGSFFDNLTK